MSDERLEELIRSLHLHLARRARLTNRRSLTPWPINFLCIHTSDHIIQEISNIPFTPPYRNLLWILTNFFHILTNIIRMDRKNIGIILSTKLRRITMSHKLTYLRDQELSLFKTRSNGGSQVDVNIWLTPIGNPKYRNGIDSVLQRWKSSSIWKNKGSTSMMHRHDISIRYKTYLILR